LPKGTTRSLSLPKGTLVSARWFRHAGFGTLNQRAVSELAEVAEGNHPFPELAEGNAGFGTLNQRD